MSDYVHLLGAEGVANAGHAMERAATEIKNAALSMEHSLSQHERFMDDWLNRFEAILQARKGE